MTKVIFCFCFVFISNVYAVPIDPAPTTSVFRSKEIMPWRWAPPVHKKPAPDEHSCP
jgi:hypothetical protein